MTTVSGNFEVHCALTQQRTIKITGVIYDDDTPAEISKRVDVAQDELDRQFMRGDIINKTAQIEGKKENIRRMREHCDGLLKKKETGKLSSQEKLALGGFDTSLKHEMDQIESLHAAIVEGKRKLGIA